MLGDTPTIVDTGHVSQQHQLQALIRHHLPLEHLHQIINTHLHSDHCGGNAHLQHLHASPATFIPCGQWGAVQEWSFLKETHESIGQKCPPFNAENQIRPNTEMNINGRVWQIHAAPGHDMDAMVLFAPKEKILISGDAFWENGFGVVFPELNGEVGFQHIEQTLLMIEDLQPRLVVPGHGPVFTHLQNSLDKAKSKLDYFRGSPGSHASYAATVLLKFKLMHEQEMQREALQTWLSSAPTLLNIRERFFQDLSAHAWLDHLLNKLSTKKSISIHGSTIINL